MTKIIVYKQFTTYAPVIAEQESTVSSMTKIIVYKQFTTVRAFVRMWHDCFQYDKDTMTLLNSVIGNLFLINFVEWCAIKSVLFTL